jgi:DUF1009 family protein
LEPVGIIAGTGNLPLHIVDRAVTRGHQVLALAFPGVTDPAIESLASETVWLKPGQLQKAISVFNQHGITRIVMAGKLEKRNLMRPWNLGLDRRAVRLIRSLQDWRDDTILAAIAQEFINEGITVEEITRWADDLMAPLGVLTRRAPTRGEWKDIAFGREMALGIGSLDIGQAVVVKNGAVIVVEAIDGTDLAIRKAADLDIRDAVVVKMAKPNQDMRFDVPGVGSSTIESMIAARARVLAVEAGKTMITDNQETIRKADKAKISIVGIPAEGPLGGKC